MHIHAADFRLHMTRRRFLRTLGAAVAVGFTAVADELARLFRWCSCGGAPRFAGAQDSVTHHASVT